MDLKTHFIQHIIEDDLKTGKHHTIVTRFPPEPNGYLHIGHAKSIYLNFGLAKAYHGRCYLRFDDTNPMKEEDIYVKAIQEDVKWLGFRWHALTHASDYYQILYDFAVYLIEQGLAYVDSLKIEEIKQYRGSLSEKGQLSPYRDRSIEENIMLFQKMKAGDFPDGMHVLRAKIDMASGNINMRDPVLYRIRHVSHQRTQRAWCIYPMYDYAHPLCDALEQITHSLCTLEFQDHRPLYEWLIEHLPVPAQPRQIEFSRLNLSHTVTSKRKLKQLVEEGIVMGWDDPRLPTLQGMRHRGYPAQAILLFCERIGFSKAESVIDMSVLEDCVREVLNQTAPRALGVKRPLKVIIDNYPLHHVESLEVDSGGFKRQLPFSRELYIEQDDFMESPTHGFFRLSVGQEVRLRYAYVIRCVGIERHQQDAMVTLHCHYDVDTLGQNPVGRKVKGVIHWVSSLHAQAVQFIEYDRLFIDENPARDDHFLQYLNPESMRIIHGFIEPALAKVAIGQIFQLERLGYYKISENHVFQKIVALKDTWSKHIHA